MNADKKEGGEGGGEGQCEEGSVSRRKGRERRTVFCLFCSTSSTLLYLYYWLNTLIILCRSLYGYHFINSMIVIYGLSFQQSLFPFHGHFQCFFGTLDSRDFYWNTILSLLTISFIFTRWYYAGLYISILGLVFELYLTSN